MTASTTAAPATIPAPEPADGFGKADLPALYVAADAASQEGQTGHKRLVKAELALLLGAAVVSAVQGLVGPSPLRWERAIAALLLAGAVFVKLALRLRSYDAQWFDGRAVAETVKSAMWRYAMRVPPYDGDEAAADQTFLRALDEAIDARPDLVRRLHHIPADGQQITPRMRALRELPLAERERVYLTARVGDQIGWYAGKSKANGKAAALWFWLGLAFEGAALFLAIALVAATGAPDLVGLLAAVGIAVTAWAQLGRHDELCKSYALAAHELMKLRRTVERATTEEAFAHAVAETESAISREHTMWMAKRG